MGTSVHESQRTHHDSTACHQLIVRVWNETSACLSLPSWLRREGAPGWDRSRSKECLTTWNMGQVQAMGIVAG